jgi:plastocyanin
MFISQNVFATLYTVQVQNYSFNPSSLNVVVGDTVKWVWVNGSHTTTSSTIPPGASSWDSPINSSHQTYTYPVTIAGSYNYVCTPHASMGMVGSFVAAMPTLQVTPPSQHVAQGAGTTNFSVVSNSSWTALSDTSWCIVTPSGSGNGTITANYQANPTNAQRTAMITVTVNGIPSQMVSVVQDGTVGVNDQNATSFTLYPNPVKDKLTITSGSSRAVEGRISVFDLNGRQIAGPVIISGASATIDFSGFADGVYFLRITTAEGNSIQRITKQE